jgi:hypothetical protein
MGAEGSRTTSSRGGEQRSARAAPSRDADGCDACVRVVEPPTPAAVAAITERVRGLVEGPGRTVLILDVTHVDEDLRSLDALARLELTAIRMGCELRLVDASEGLRALAAFAGLAGVLPFDRSDVEARRQPEQREQPLGGEEEHDPADLAVDDVDDLQ